MCVCTNLNSSNTGKLNVGSNTVNFVPRSLHFTPTVPLLNSKIWYWTISIANGAAILLGMFILF